LTLFTEGLEVGGFEYINIPDIIRVVGIETGYGLDD
jgi:hypothetical protein